MPVQGLTGCGARQRRLPTGGAAKGMPLNEVIPSAATPSTRPPVTGTTSICAAAGLIHTNAIAASAAPIQIRPNAVDLVIVPSARAPIARAPFFYFEASTRVLQRAEAQ